MAIQHHPKSLKNTLLYTEHARQRLHVKPPTVHLQVRWKRDTADIRNEEVRCSPATRVPTMQCGGACWSAVQVRLHQDLRAVLDPVEEGTYRRDVVQARLKQPLRTWRCRVSGSEGSSAPAAQTTGAFSLCHTFICMQPFCSTFKCLGIYLQNRSKRSYGER